MTRLVVDWAACDGQGMCAAWAPGLVTRDDWGFPVVRSQVGAEELPAARAAVRSCPRLALRLVPGRSSTREVRTKQS